MDIYKQAIYSQCACNLSGLMYSMPKIADAIWKELREEKDEANDKWADTAAFNQHPVARLFAEQFAHLTREIDYSKASQICEERAERAEKVRILTEGLRREIENLKPLVAALDSLPKNTDPLGIMTTEGGR